MKKHEIGYHNNWASTRKADTGWTSVITATSWLEVTQEKQPLDKFDHCHFSTWGCTRKAAIGWTNVTTATSWLWQCRERSYWMNKCDHCPFLTWGSKRRAAIGWTSVTTATFRLEAVQGKKLLDEQVWALPLYDLRLHKKRSYWMNKCHHCHFLT